MGVGILRDTAEGFLMPDLFDASRQIGCFPEPANGYPIQLWGLLAEIAGQKLMEYKIASFKNMTDLGVDRLGLDHACGLLGGFTTFPVFTPDGARKLDPNKFPDDARIAEEGGEWHFKPGDEEARQAYAKDLLLSLLKEVPGLRFTAETVGDKERRVAAELAVKAAIEAGHDITLMRALPWEDTPLSDYGLHDRLSGTHDMPTLAQLLTGHAGEHIYEWVNGGFVSKFLGRLGILAPFLSATFADRQLSPELMIEMHRRVLGSGAETVVLPLSSLFLLQEKHLNSGKWQNTNVRPGTPGEIGTDPGNWAHRLPNVENLLASKDIVHELGERQEIRIEEPRWLETCRPTDSFHAQVKKVGEEKVVYQNAEGRWTVYDPELEGYPIMELAVTYTGGDEFKEWTHYNVSTIGLQADKEYTFRDLVSGEEFKNSGKDLLERGLVVGLSKEHNRHHFVVFED